MSVYLKDLRERVLMTFVQGFLGSLVVTEFSDKSMWLAAAGGGVAAVAALLKGVVAKWRGNSESASLDGDV
jgi:phosphatidylserine synthase